MHAQQPACVAFAAGSFLRAEGGKTAWRSRDEIRYTHANDDHVMQPLQLNALWIGERLATLQQLCLLSAIQAGHRLRLFAYGRPHGVPDAIELADAREIYPESAIIRHHKTGSPSLFADRFRYEIARRGFGAWMDTDILMLRPLEPESPLICGWESSSLVGNSLLYLGPGSSVLKAMCEESAKDYPNPQWYLPPLRAYLDLRRRLGRPVHISRLPWGVVGPGLLTHVLRSQGKLNEAWPIHRIYPISYKEKFGPFRRDYDHRARIKSDTVCVHLWAQGLYGGLSAPTGRSLPIAEPGSLVAIKAREIGLRL